MIMVDSNTTWQERYDHSIREEKARQERVQADRSTWEKVFDSVGTGGLPDLALLAAGLGAACIAAIVRRIRVRRRSRAAG